MANTITGKFVAASKQETVASKEAGREPLVKRSIVMDCTKYDPNTGEMGRSNTPLLEFTGKALDKLEELINGGLAKDDVITVSFNINGFKYTKDGKTRIFTAVRPYDISLARKAQPEAPVQAVQQVDVPEPATDSDLPF